MANQIQIRAQARQISSRVCCIILKSRSQIATVSWRIKIPTCRKWTKSRRIIARMPLLSNQRTTIVPIMKIKRKSTPLCFVTRIQKHYREFPAKLDTISKEYYIQDTGLLQTD